MTDSGETKTPGKIRQDLVGSAVRFLENPRVSESPLDLKRKFLAAKGLTEEEVEEAFRRAKPSPASQQSLALPTPPPVPPPYYAPAPYHGPPSFWMQVRDFLNAFALIFGVSYGVYYIYKKHVRQWLFDCPAEKSQEKAVAELIHNLNQSVQELKESVAELKTAMEDKDQRISAIVQEEVANAIPTQRINDIKSEVASVKGLLLGRKQFPPTPSVAPGIPAWQLPSASKKDKDEKNAEDEDGEETFEEEEEERVVSMGSTNGSSSCEVVMMSSKSENSVGVTGGVAVPGGGGSDTSQGSAEMPE